MEGTTISGMVEGCCDSDSVKAIVREPSRQFSRIPYLIGDSVV